MYDTSLVDAKILNLCFDLDNTIINSNWDHKPSIRELAKLVNDLKEATDIDIEVSFISGRDLDFMNDFSNEAHKIFDEVQCGDSISYLCGENGNVLTKFKADAPIAYDEVNIITKSGDLSQDKAYVSKFRKDYHEILYKSPFVKYIKKEDVIRITSYEVHIHQDIQRDSHDLSYIKEINQYLTRELRKKAYSDALVNVQYDYIEAMITLNTFSTSCRFFNSLC
jgi:hydroxymethylpyrimidine pyrophosphatase-like HAD family hydrolase